MEFIVEQVVLGVTWVLRQQVLRPFGRVPEMGMPGDELPTSAHFAAYDASGLPGSYDEIVGVASVFAEPEPEPEPESQPEPGPAAPAVWRLRGMATAERVRGQGVGAALLHRVVDHVQRAGGGGLWANARIGALGFYTRHEFVVVSPEFELPHIGVHRRVRLR